MKYELQSAIECEQLAQHWRTLETTASNPFFLSWYWIGTWLQAMQPDVLILRGTQGDSVKLLALWGMNKTRIKRLIPVTQLLLHRTGDEHQDQIWIEYNGLLHDEQVTAEQLRGALAYLQQEAGQWDELVIGASEAGQLDPFLHLGLSRIDAWEAPGYAVDLASIRQQGGDYLRTLSKNTRYQLGRARRMLESMGSVSYACAASMDEALQWFEQAGVWHRQRWGDQLGQSGFANVLFCQFHVGLIKAGFADGVIELCKFALDGKTLAIQYNFIYRKRVYFYLSGIDFAGFDDSKLKIGLLMHLYAIESHLARGNDCYDFMAGDARYKRSLGKATGSQFLSRLRKRKIKYRLEDWGRLHYHRLRKLKTNQETEPSATHD